MTDKAAVEVPAPVSGRVVSIRGAPGDKIAVGSPLIVFETAPGATTAASPLAASTPRSATPAASAPPPVSAPPPARAQRPVSASAPAAETPPAPVPAVASGEISARVAPAAAPGEISARAAPAAGRIMTSPANRRRAREAGIDLATVAGSGPGGRIVREDLDAAGAAPTDGNGADGRHTLAPGDATGRNGGAPGAALPGPIANVPGAALPGTAVQGAAVPGAAAPGAAARSPRAIVGETSEIKVIGVRRLIAERMSEAKRNIPHFAYVEEVDVTELEALRQHLNSKLAKGEPSFTYLPLVILALVRTLESFPQCNVLYDATRGVLVRHRAVHVGVATQTPDGLKVPVVRDAQAMSLEEVAAETRRVTERARTSRATREELQGSTITVTSLGKLGGIASTPIINAPEVAIIGLNKAVDRPVVHHGAVTVRRIMNLSSSFDHRFVDGYDAAAMIQSLKERLEHPAMIFIPKVDSP
jgi:2-oxoisovalerate dehydrogenase E2 component (dihydrolipoyl transacylase)